MAKKQSRKYPNGYEGHDIIDKIVMNNADRNRVLYDNACSIPHYFGGVNIGEDQLKLAVMKDKKNITTVSLINDIIYSTENLQLDASTVGVILDSRTGEGITHKVHPTIIKFIKSCIASSYNPCEDFSIVVSACVKEILDHIQNITLPLELPKKNKTQKLIAEGLNDYFKKLCDETNTSYSTVIDVPKKGKKSVNQLLEQASK